MTPLRSTISEQPEGKITETLTEDGLEVRVALHKPLSMGDRIGYAIIILAVLILSLQVLIPLFNGDLREAFEREFGGPVPAQLHHAGGR